MPWEADATTWRFTYVGPQFVKLLGYPLEEWYEKDFWTAHLHPADREHAIDFLRNLPGSARTTNSNTAWSQQLYLGGARCPIIFGAPVAPEL